MALHTSPQYVAGDFRLPIQVQRPDYVSDGVGGQITTWLVHLDSILCAVENKQGSEPYGDKATGRVRTFQKFVFTTWYGYDIQQTDRILFQGLLYNIRQVNNLKLLNKFLQIEADAGVEQ
jgi:SPP1 family predicted phage head-tail adaptor